MNKKELAERIAEKNNLTKKASFEIVNSVVDEIIESLKKGEDVELVGLGKLTIKERPGRIGINPKTMEKVEVEPTKVVSFKASKNLKELVK